MGFFGVSDSPRIEIPLLPNCGKCGLLKQCRTPKMPLSGKGRKKILIVGEAPGENEDLQGRPFCGRSGDLLARTLLRLGIDMRQDCWITNALSCHPPRNLLPEKAVDYCRPLVVQKVRELKPEVMILLGGAAVRSVLGWIWKEDVGRINKWVGWTIPHQQLNCWIVPNFHPAHVLRNEPRNGGPDPYLSVFQDILADAASLVGSPPYQHVPDYRKRVKILLDDQEAVSYIHSMIGTHPVAWDLETNMLKPYPRNAEILCCSLSDGRGSIAYPWTRKTQEATFDFLESDTPKFGYNIKFETTWIRTLYGVEINNWDAGLDGMIAAHILDNRQGVSGLKFQAFVTLGMDAYDQTVKPYMKASGGNTVNRLWDFVRRYGWEPLLLYCGLDSLLEHKICSHQMNQLGIA